MIFPSTNAAYFRQSAVCQQIGGRGPAFFPWSRHGGFLQNPLKQKNDPVRFSGRAVFLLKDRQAGGEWFPVLLLLTERVGGGRRRHPSLLIAKRF
ncbi:hypothetical protein FO478_00375 [Heyndrickxia coagulans DSM 1 = ATCC 7050]|nr:hypothetical protein [Heyndrickxia coagulans DSM 1 = ATCC 7050]RGR87555.1 hypothetical protein DWY22_04310 [Heyndrickxia coagulans]RGR99717.1 hypothetical protein DWY16_04465 [Heyndrickxia coagulans]